MVRIIHSILRMLLTGFMGMWMVATGTYRYYSAMHFRVLFWTGLGICILFVTCWVIEFIRFYKQGENRYTDIMDR